MFFKEEKAEKGSGLQGFRRGNSHRRKRRHTIGGVWASGKGSARMEWNKSFVECNTGIAVAAWCLKVGISPDKPPTETKWMCVWLWACTYLLHIAVIRQMPFFFLQPKKGGGVLMGFKGWEAYEQKGLSLFI